MTRAILYLMFTPWTEAEEAAVNARIDRIIGRAAMASAEFLRRAFPAYGVGLWPGARCGSSDCHAFMALLEAAERSSVASSAPTQLHVARPDVGPWAPVFDLLEGILPSLLVN